MMASKDLLSRRQRIFSKRKNGASWMSPGISCDLLPGTDSSLHGGPRFERPLEDDSTSAKRVSDDGGSADATSCKGETTAVRRWATIFGTIICGDDHGCMGIWNAITMNKRWHHVARGRTQRKLEENPAKIGHKTGAGPANTLASDVGGFDRLGTSYATRFADRIATKELSNSVDERRASQDASSGAGGRETELPIV
jgi:hypothetical protein